MFEKFIRRGKFIVSSRAGEEFTIQRDSVFKIATVFENFALNYGKRE